MPEPGDTFVFVLQSEQYKWPTEGFYRWEELKSLWTERNDFTPLQIVCTSARLDRPITELLERLQRFAPLGLVVPKIDQPTPNDLRLDKEDLIMLSESLDGYGRYITRISPDHLVRAAMTLDKPIAVIFDRLQQFVSFGVQVPEVDLKILGATKVTQEDFALLSTLGLSYKHQWQNSSLGPLQIAQTAVRTGQSIATILERLRKFVLVGLQLVDVDQTFWGGLSVTQDDLILLSRDLNGYPPWLQGEVSKRHVFQAAFKLKQPIEAILTRLRQFQPLGLILPQGDPKTWQD